MYHVVSQVYILVVVLDIQSQLGMIVSSILCHGAQTSSGAPRPLRRNFCYRDFSSTVLRTNELS